MDREKITTTKKRAFDSILEDYAQMVCKVIQQYQKREFNTDAPVYFKKELLRHLGMSADLARKIVGGSITETNTMIHVLDVMENILSLYDPGSFVEGRKALLKRKNYFFRTYVVSVDLAKPIIQKGKAPVDTVGHRLEPEISLFLN